MRNFLPVVAIFLTACPDQSGQPSCPPGASLIGQYTLAFTALHDAGVECVATPDAGKPIKLTSDDAGTKGATLCLGSDGGLPELNFLVAGKSGVYKDVIDPEGKFSFQSDPVIAQQTVCVCDVQDVQTFAGVLVAGTPDAGFALQPDGGLPPVTGLSATSIDSLSAAGTGCVCAFPCTVTYAVTGTRF